MRQTFTILLLLYAASLMLAQTGDTLFGQARAAELAGDLPGAIALYERIVREFPSNRTLVARALFQLGEIHERTEQPARAREYFARLVRDHADSDAAARAKTRLAALGPVEPDVPTMVVPLSYTFTDSGSRKPFAISPDGTLLVYAGNNRLYSRPLPGPSGFVAIPGTEGVQATNPVFSPDGKSLAFWARTQGVIKRISVGGGVAATLYQPELEFNTMSWAPHDDLVVGLGPGGIVRIPADGKAPHTIVTMTNGESAFHPQLLPGGRAVLFTVMSPAAGYDWDKALVAVQSLTTGERKIVAKGASEARHVTSGHVLFTRGLTLFAVPFNLERLEPSEGEVQILDQVERRTNPDNTYEVALYTLSENGTLAYVRGEAPILGDSWLDVFNRTDGSVRRLPLPTAPIYGTPRVSPNDREVVYAMGDLKEQNLYIYDLSEASAPRQLTRGSVNIYPVWSSDGTMLFFSSNREGDWAVFATPADGSRPPERLTKTADGSMHFPTSFANGILLFNKVTQGNRDIWAYSMKDKSAVPVLEGPPAQSEGVLSPDGRLIAYMENNAEGNWEMFLAPFPVRGGAKPIPIAEWGWWYPIWSADGKELYYKGDNQGVWSRKILETEPTLVLAPPASALPGRPLTRRTGSSQSNLALWPHWFDVTRDNQRFIVAGLDPPAGRRLDIHIINNVFELLKERARPR